jgi:hypothetical protein
MRIGRLEALARIGFAARGLLYLLVGWFALGSGRPEDGSGAMRHLAGGPGSVLLAGMALGFFGYGMWRLGEAWIDTQGAGSSAKGIALRLGGATSGLLHLGLGLFAFSRVIRGGGSEPASGGSAEAGAATALSLPAGQLVLALAAALLVAAALVQLGKAVRLGFLRHLDPRAARLPAVAWIGRIGFAARGLVFAVMGVFLLQAAWKMRAAAAGDMGDALAALPDSIRMLVAGGLVLFALFSLVEARFRRITDPHVLRRLRAAGAARGLV